MANILTQNFTGTGVSNGTEVTTANSGVTALNPTATFFWTNSPAAFEGSWWIRCTTAGVNGTLRQDFTSASSVIYWYAAIRMETINVAASLIQFALDATIAFNLRQNTDNSLSIRDGNTTRASSPVLSVGQTYQLVGKLQPQTATTGMYLKIYDASGTLVWNSGNQTLNTVAVATLDNIKIGLTSGAPTSTMYFDRLLVDNAAEPSIVFTAPTPSAGADQTGVDPITTVTLTGSATGGSGSYTYSWSQVSGSPSVTLSGSGASRTFQAPATVAGTTLTFRVTVNDGVASPVTDDVSVTVLPHNDWTKVGGSWVPAVFKTRASGAWS